MTESDGTTAAALALPYGGCPLPGVATAGQPTEAQLGALKAAGYQTVLDLRAPHEPRGYDEPAAARRAGLEYVALPIAGSMVADETFDRFRAIMRDPARRPVLVHCKSANRVGGLLLPYLILDEHRPLPDALRTAQEVGLTNPELADAALDYARRNSVGGADV